MSHINIVIQYQVRIMLLYVRNECAFLYYYSEVCRKFCPFSTNNANQILSNNKPEKSIEHSYSYKQLTGKVAVRGAIDSCAFGIRKYRFTEVIYILLLFKILQENYKTLHLSKNRAPYRDNYSKYCKSLLS